MFSRKIVGPRMEHNWETPTLTGYSYEDFPSRTTWSHRRKEEIRPNNWPENPDDLNLWRRPAWETMSKRLDISSARAQVAPDLLKILAILSDTSVRRSADKFPKLLNITKFVNSLR